MSWGIQGQTGSPLFNHSIKIVNGLDRTVVSQLQAFAM